jgi:hypothetical protein
MKKFIVILTMSLGAALAFNSCSKASSGTTTTTTSVNPDRTAGSYTYSTTSNVGDYAEWTFDGVTILLTDTTPARLIRPPVPVRQEPCHALVHHPELLT